VIEWEALYRWLGFQFAGPPTRSVARLKRVPFSNVNCGDEALHEMNGDLVKLKTQLSIVGD